MLVSKTKYVLLISFLYFALTVNGQGRTFKPEWNVGIGFGPTFSSVDFQPRVNVKNIMQYHGGVALRYISEKNLGLIAELNFTQQGWKENFEETPEYAHSHHLNYLELPLLTHIYFGNKVRFSFNLGPKISFLISDSEKMNTALSEYLASGNLDPYQESHQYYRMAQKRIDYGLTGGMGMEFKTGVGGFLLEGRYAFGLGDIYNSKKTDYFARSANRVISAKLTYYVKLF